MKIMILPCLGISLFYLHSVQSACALVSGDSEQRAKYRIIFYCCSSNSAERFNDVINHTCSYCNMYVIIKLLILADSCSLPLCTNGINGIGGLCSLQSHLETCFNEDIMKQNIFLVEDNDSK